MTSHHVSVKRRIGAPAPLSYGIIADYRNGHPRIVPPKVFQNLIVEEGGTGAGTTIRFDMRVFGKLRHARARIAEPSPGRVLTEEELDTGTFTTFLVEPADGGRACDVTITTELKLPDGPFAALQGKVAVWFLRRVYADELGLLDAEARRRDRSTHGPAAA